MDFTRKCRTCLEFREEKIYLSITQQCSLGNTYQDVITMLVPDTAKTLLNSDIICEDCADTLKRCIKFIQHCTIIEEILRKCKLTPTEFINFSDENLSVNTENEVATDDVKKPNNHSNTVIKNIKRTTHSIDEDHDYFNTKEFPDESNFLPEIKKHKLVISLKQQDLSEREKIINNLTGDQIPIIDISRKTAPDSKKRVLLLGKNIPLRCNTCSRIIKPYAVHKCNPEDMKSKKSEQCLKCHRKIISIAMPIHIAKHEREALREIEREKQREARRLARLVCKICDEKFTTEDEYQYHLTIHPPHICEQCGKGFAKRESFLAHRETHNDPNSFICEVCGKGFKEKVSFRNHLAIHKPPGTFKCTRCPKIFKMKSRLARHMKQVHDKTHKIQCTECGKLFYSKSTYNSHVKVVHTGEKPYECNICSSKFARMDYLRKHKFLHTDLHIVKTNNCQVTRIFGKGNRMLKYEILNNVDHPVGCKFCGKYFQNLLKLKRHLETHFKRFPCQFCPLTFSRKAFCQRHEKIHEGGTINFFRCNVCWKRMTTKEALDVHMTCHDKPRYSCDWCGKPFNRRFLMNHHILAEHEPVQDKVEAEKMIYDSLVEASGGSGVSKLLNEDILYKDEDQIVMDTDETEQ